ncbi:hypothetical protein NUU61_000808 [Penicillium alfredii]|uniref:DNA replication regulator SLD2 n=1 Tax=Penicillium alfredii TaxID=1506179 RepID=A0A9W9KQ28_9EURO|nr:uncharacterized protein NUU61_000808 [Penicillium alfredii]KAJ5115049.1 hypothetical protein NUU61_000808 [Penicillium alfredii]
MADNALSSRTEVANEAASVRAELKIWEKEFASTHDGKKAGRDDIKQNPDIAAKYKEYGRLKALESSLARRENRRHEPSDSHSKKRKHASPTENAHAHMESTPRKSAKGLFATPSHPRTKAHPSQLDPYDSPSTLRRLFSPSTHRQSMPAPSPLKPVIGPTPQRDGKALGLFDLLSESGGSNATPSGKKKADTLAAGFQTPSKKKTVEPIPEAPEEDQEQETPRLARTPASSTKQFYLANLFATPTTMRYAAMVEAEDNAAQDQGPQDAVSAAAPETALSGTPSFLRRSNSGRYLAPNANRDSSGLSPMVSRKPQQFAGKGLSHLVQGLRAMEEEQLDDDWDVLREIEADQEEANIEVADSQVPIDEVRRPYKKKGQKRTTRKVTMRPVAPRAKPRPNPAAATHDADPESDDELAAVPETQHLGASPNTYEDNDQEENEGDGDDAASLHTMSDPELDSDADPTADSDGDPEYADKPKPLPKTKSFSERIKEAVSSTKPKTKETQGKAPEATGKEEKKPRARKINPQAHANYRSLKIGNKGSRGRGGRFRRR